MGILHTLSFFKQSIVILCFHQQNLVNLNFMQEKKEADFRYGLVRVRENAESIAFYGGEENELQLLLDRFRRAFDNLSVSNVSVSPDTLVHYFFVFSRHSQNQIRILNH